MLLEWLDKTRFNLTAAQKKALAFDQGFFLSIHHKSKKEDSKAR